MIRAIDPPVPVADKNYFITSVVNSQYGIVNAALGEPRTFGATLRGQL